MPLLTKVRGTNTCMHCERVERQVRGNNTKVRGTNTCMPLLASAFSGVER